MRKNSERRELPCKVCHEIVNNVGHDAIAVTCNKCVTASLEEFNKNPKAFINNVHNKTRNSG